MGDVRAGVFILYRANLCRKGEYVQLGAPLAVGGLSALEVLREG